jgi:Ca2+-binding EF-hand superfamily protein
MKSTLIAIAAGLSLAGAAGAQTSPQPSASAARQAFEVADLDHDGYISLAEFQKDVLHSWRALDADGDGYISRDEVHLLPQHGPGLYRSLQRADRNGDGKLSFKEVVDARMDYFDHADTNADDLLSLAEVMAYRQRNAGDTATRR